MIKDLLRNYFLYQNFCSRIIFEKLFFYVLINKVIHFDFLKSFRIKKSIKFVKNGHSNLEPGLASSSNLEPGFYE